MRALVCLLNYDGNPLIGLRLDGVPVCNVWGYERHDVLTRAFREVTETFLPLDPTIECVAFVAEELATVPENLPVIHQLIHAFGQTGLAVTAPVPFGAAGMPRWERHTVKAHRVTRRTPFFLQALDFAAFDPAQVQRLAAHPGPWPAATAADPTAPDYAICRALGGLAPVRLVIHRPTQDHSQTCPDIVLLSVPDLLATAPPTAT